VSTQTRMKPSSGLPALPLGLVALIALLLAWGCTGASQGDNYKTLLVPGGSLAYALTGSGPQGQGQTPGLTVVLLHGLGGNRGVWSKLLPMLEVSGRVVAIDLPGHGDSQGAPQRDWSVASVAEDVLALTRRLDLAPMVLVGHGWGAQIAVRVACEAHGGVRGLFLVDPMPQVAALETSKQRLYVEGLLGPTDPEETYQWLARPLSDGLSAPEYDAHLQGLRALGRSVLVSVYQGMFSYDALADLTRWRGAMLALVGDANTGPLALHNMAVDLPFQEIAGKGHFLMLTAPQQLAEALNSFVGLLEH